MMGSSLSRGRWGIHHATPSTRLILLWNKSNSAAAASRSRTELVVPAHTAPRFVGAAMGAWGDVRA